MDEKERSPLARDEEKILKFWGENQIFEKSLKKNLPAGSPLSRGRRSASAKDFTFYDGPPFATGLPHYGHILASTIKDVIPRYQTMKGRFVRRRWGWDCHGLPIEEIVERKLGISGKKQIESVGIKKFNETCRSMVLEYAHEWRKMIRRIARWVEFDDSYKTMDADYMESVWWAFKEIYKKKLVYEGRKVLLYCPRCETPVSNFEVAMDNSYKDVTEEAVTIKFHLKSGQKIGKDFTTDDKTYILSWTTTPWTLPGNVALAVGEKIAYTALHVDGTKELYIVAKERVKAVFKDQVIDIVHDDIKGKDLIGLEYEPLFNVPPLRQGSAGQAAGIEKAFKIYPADFVTTDEGTGVVHTAVVYGEEDYALGLKEGLPIVPLLDEKGVFNEKAPELVHGKYFKDSEKFIKKDLEERGLLLERKMHQHSYPYCWRCGNVLFYNAIPAWFINIQKIKSKLLKSNNKEINWFPGHLKHGRYEKSVEAAPDWNISRNRYWGNPIPVWKCEKCKREEVIGSLEELAKRTRGPKNNYWIMRHGFSENLVGNILDSGQKDLHLTTLGRDEVRRAAEKLKNDLARRHEKVDIIVSSDVLRTRETAEIASEVLGAPAHFDKRLEEIHLGIFDGCHSGKWHDKFPTLKSRFEGAPEGGETLRDLRGRLWKFLEETEKKHKGKNILLVSHEYPIWMMRHVAEGWSEKRAMQEKTDRGGDFVRPAELRALDLKILPRNDEGLIDLHRPYIDDITFACNSCDGVMKRTSEIFDSWMEAGSMPFAEYHYPFENKKVFESRLPAQFVAEYIAQTRAWFYVMHVVSHILFGKAPFENVVTTGTILAEDGSKMSKSKENFSDPNLIIEKYGADSLRFYLMNSVVMQADNLNFSEKGVESAYRKVGLLLRNVYKYFETYFPGAMYKPKPDPGEGNVLDLWIKARTQGLVDGVTRYLDAYDTVHATRLIQEYVDDLSTWYLRRSRRRSDAAFWVTLRESLLTVSKVIAPFMPFLAEELYRKLGRQEIGDRNQESVHLTDWPKAKPRTMNHELIVQMAEVRRLASLALAKRAEAKIKVRQPLAKLRIKNLESRIKNDKKLLEILADEVNVKEVVFDASINDAVELDTAITPMLRREGIVREVARMIQGLRQDAGFKPADKIVVMFEAAEEIKKAIIENEAGIVSDVGAKAVEYRKSDKFDAEEATKIDNQDVWVAIRKI
ncbi:MAG: class I tRNA ligase family protein [Candidatus Liptonbacteria bacterium]|nr:class I tRNA ligase family protein [Candidatus Liptonbacteria bacterium]